LEIISKYGEIRKNAFFGSFSLNLLKNPADEKNGHRTDENSNRTLLIVSKMTHPNGRRHEKQRKQLKNSTYTIGEPH